MTRRACEEERPAGVLRPTTSPWLGDGPRSDQWQREPSTWTPSVSEVGRWLASSFLQSTCWPGLTRISFLDRVPTHDDAGRGHRHSTGDYVRGELPPPSKDHRQLRQTDRQAAEGRQQRGERETQKGPRVLSLPRVVVHQPRERPRERVAVACANGAMQARDSSTRQRIKALLHVQSISLCSVSPSLAPPPLYLPPPPRWDRGWVREGTRPTGQRRCCWLATMCGYGEM